MLRSVCVVRKTPCKVDDPFDLIRRIKISIDPNAVLMTMLTLGPIGKHLLQLRQFIGFPSPDLLLSPVPLLQNSLIPLLILPHFLVVIS